MESRTHVRSAEAVGGCTIEEGGYDNKGILAAKVMAKCLVPWASMEIR